MKRNEFIEGTKVFIKNNNDYSITEYTIEKVGRDFVWLTKALRINIKTRKVQKKKGDSWIDFCFLSFYTEKIRERKRKLIETLFNRINQYNKYIKKHETCKQLGEHPFLLPDKERLFDSSIEYLNSAIEQTKEEFDELVERIRIYEELKTKQNEQQSDESSTD